MKNELIGITIRLANMKAGTRFAESEYGRTDWYVAVTDAVLERPDDNYWTLNAKHEETGNIVLFGECDSYHLKIYAS